MPDPRTETAEEGAFFDAERASERVSTEPELQPEVAETPEPELSAEPEAEEHEEGRTVPLAELMAERQRRKELNNKVQQLEETFQRFMQRTQQQPPAQQPPPGPQIPDFEADPFGHLRARLDLVQNATVSGIQQTQQQNAVAQLISHVQGLENEFRAQAPDYDAAIQHTRALRMAEMQALGYDATTAHQMLQQETLQISARAIQSGQNPAKLFYDLAKVRGFQAPNGGGAAAPKSAPVQPAQKFATVQRAQAATRSMPKGGAAPTPALTLESLANMSDDDFDANFERLFRGS